MDLIIYYFALFISSIITSSAAFGISIKGDHCSKYDACYTKPLLRTCSCDQKCYLFGTCCYDMKLSKGNHFSSIYQCYSNRTISPVFAKRSCSDDYRGHEGYVHDCFDDEVDEMDVKSHLLVTSHKTKVTYWNDRCAACNNEADADLMFWSIEVFCPPRPEINRNVIRKNLTFDGNTRQWGLKLEDGFLRCIVKYAPPPYFDEVKQCTPNLISTCPGNYHNENIIKRCFQYYGRRKLRNSNVYYRNVHCAICNGVDIEDLECPGLGEIDENIEETDFREMVEEVFTKGEWLLKEKGKLFECSIGHAYDPFRKRCRKDHIPLALSSTNASQALKVSTLLLVVLLLFFYWF